MARSRNLQESFQGNLSVTDKLGVLFGKHGLPGLVIAALFFLTFTLHKDNVQMATTTIREVTLSAYELKEAINAQTEVVRQYSLKGAKVDTVYIPTLGDNSSVRYDSAYGSKRDDTQIFKVSGSHARSYGLAPQQKISRAN
jgi:hypothetical protein